jgi:uncharacterized membrane protein SpoIIM required for sporulation
MGTSYAGRRASAAFYRRFVAARQRAWDEAEALLKRAGGDPRLLGAGELLRLAELYPEVAADLAFVQREFDSNRLCEHLSWIVGESYRLLYRHGEDRGGGFRGWLARSLPAAARAALPDLAAMTALFLVASLVGFFFTLERPAFGRAFVSPEMEAALRSGKLWTESVFSATPPSVASSFIVSNNISVTFIAFAGGILLGLGTLYIVAFNGLMLGAVFAVCREYGKAGALLGFVCGHGFLEIGAILLAAAAGLGLARSLLAPGRLPRPAALQDAAQRAVALLLLTGVSLLLAGLVEGFVSPSPLVPVPFKLALGLILAGGLAVAVSVLAKVGALRRGDSGAGIIQAR